MKNYIIESGSPFLGEINLESKGFLIVFSWSNLFRALEFSFSKRNLAWVIIA